MEMLELEKRKCVLQAAGWVSAYVCASNVSTQFDKQCVQHIVISVRCEHAEARTQM